MNNKEVDAAIFQLVGDQSGCVKALAALMKVETKTINDWSNKRLPRKRAIQILALAAAKDAKEEQDIICDGRYWSVGVAEFRERDPKILNEVVVTRFKKPSLAVILSQSEVSGPMNTIRPAFNKPKYIWLSEKPDSALAEKLEAAGEWRAREHISRISNNSQFKYAVERMKKHAIEQTGFEQHDFELMKLAGIMSEASAEVRTPEGLKAERQRVLSGLVSELRGCENESVDAALARGERIGGLRAAMKYLDLLDGHRGESIDMFESDVAKLMATNQSRDMCVGRERKW
ncbi:hypothetical protein [Loktanella sp. M215]|uniref:hypothetical protein n=1 Tax=Loktanella sp. M215 TaxID=2675431 RepID=UPI001F399445|nr:hypothetical protein [Loktanella sp. M215]MCF7699946.1 hypothetical protein [Loktanella sp. M215]